MNEPEGPPGAASSGLECLRSASAPPRVPSRQQKGPQIRRWTDGGLVAFERTARGRVGYVTQRAPKHTAPCNRGISYEPTGKTAPRFPRRQSLSAIRYASQKAFSRRNAARYGFPLPATLGRSVRRTSSVYVLISKLTSQSVTALRSYEIRRMPALRS
jgi:hypothetical protein